MYKLIPCEHKMECIKLKGNGSCEYLHFGDDAKKYLEEYHERCYKFFTHFYANELQKEIHPKFRQMLCNNPDHVKNEFKKSTKWYLYKYCMYAHSEEEAKFYKKKAML